MATRLHLSHILRLHPLTPSPHSLCTPLPLRKGCLMTAGILGTGLYTFSRGSKFSKQSQMAMRARVIAQGATVVMLMVGTLAYNREKDTVKRRMTLKENEMIRHFQAKAAERDTLGNGARERLQGAKP